VSVPVQGAAVRALAARALARVVAGESLRSAFAVSASRLDDSRDRALLSSLVHEGARWWLRYDAAIDRLAERPLREREAQVHALLVLGLVQLDVLRLPEYAAVAATVEATRALHRPKFAGLVNALLRRWLRERDAIVARLDDKEVMRTAHPRWLIDTLRRDWPRDVAAILDADNRIAPLWLRANRRRTTRAALLERLAAAGVAAQAADDLDDAIVLAESTDVTRLPGYAEGEFSVQDGAAQWAATLLDARDGERVLDACAAPGGKSAHILERASAKLIALDADAERLPRLHENLARLGLVAEVRAGDAAKPVAWWDGIPFERILIDAPCSATGIIRRQPDIKLHRRSEDIAALAATQAHLLAALWPLLERGGRIVYATCSLFADENTRQVERFLGATPDAQCLDLAPVGWRRDAVGGAQNLPGDGGMDGFYYAVLERI